jgi:hypothetical protein
VPFHIQVVDRDEAYLYGRAELSEEGKDKVFVRLTSDLGEATQQFRDRFRVKPGSPYFEFSFFLLDQGRVHHFRTFVDDSRDAFGVLRVVYLEHTPGNQLRPV